MFEIMELEQAVMDPLVQLNYLSSRLEPADQGGSHIRPFRELPPEVVVVVMVVWLEVACLPFLISGAPLLSTPQRTVSFS